MCVWPPPFVWTAWYSTWITWRTVWLGTSAQFSTFCCWAVLPFMRLTLTFKAIHRASDAGSEMISSLNIFILLSCSRCCWCKEQPLWALVLKQSNPLEWIMEVMWGKDLHQPVWEINLFYFHINILWPRPGIFLLRVILLQTLVLW